MREVLEAGAESPNPAGGGGGALILETRRGECAACGCGMGGPFECGAVIVTTGTFLNGLAHVGEKTYRCGRNGEAPSNLLGDQLRTLGLQWTRLKTGTPPRLDGRTIEWSRFEPQQGDPEPTPFSFLTERIDRHQVPCYIAYTTAGDAPDPARSHSALASL